MPDSFVQKYKQFQKLQKQLFRDAKIIFGMFILVPPGNRDILRVSGNMEYYIDIKTKT